MSSSPRRDSELIAYVFWTVLTITILVYILRGFGVLTFIPGGIIYFLILLSLITGIWFGVEKTKRF
ncbi:MAG: hypothetical protein SAL07_01880 [Oscillatoria sp. PMC 1051.18]|uniref:hypothetical protein n=1 Tax=Oscillatoria salina TaxID=331517 RepID=UPI0013B7D97D|nr:hypothetical protein [Oscillatoria salina]MBZ8179919.1 hypothetical protein [Oscillatoria salina IIICB1]MEC4892007.1 hypothetical protein [Oscillatoria sp. PMC 1050.18]MEC5028634.1 hypothetical protein [Oscillatoria sp. PMC 1051.18]NET87466.1 hypothetical protein [Kamptonema sp. SIO1D9]